MSRFCPFQLWNGSARYITGRVSLQKDLGNYHYVIQAFVWIGVKVYWQLQYSLKYSWCWIRCQRILFSFFLFLMNLRKPFHVLMVSDIVMKWYLPYTAKEKKNFLSNFSKWVFEMWSVPLLFRSTTVSNVFFALSVAAVLEYNWILL